MSRSQTGRPGAATRSSSRASGAGPPPSGPSTSTLGARWVSVGWVGRGGVAGSECELLCAAVKSALFTPASPYHAPTHGPPSPHQRNAPQRPRNVVDRAPSLRAAAAATSPTSSSTTSGCSTRCRAPCLTPRPPPWTPPPRCPPGCSCGWRSCRWTAARAWGGGTGSGGRRC